jgi:hypothetical protein
MKVTPKTEEELQRSQLCPEGVYPFTCLEGTEKASKSVKNPGKMMFAVKLSIHAADGDYHTYDYFADWFMEHKVRHFAKSTGLLQNYEKGELDGNTFKDRTGYVQVTIEEGKGGYGPKNVVEDYFTADEAKLKMAPAPAKKSAPVERAPDDDVPF